MIVDSFQKVQGFIETTKSCCTTPSISTVTLFSISGRNVDRMTVSSIAYQYLELTRFQSSSVAIPVIVWQEEWLLGAEQE